MALNQDEKDVVAEGVRALRRAANWVQGPRSAQLEEAAAALDKLTKGSSSTSAATTPAKTTTRKRAARKASS